MKKFSIIPSVLTVLTFTGCTLYMDEPGDAGRILRTGTGYQEEEVIALPDGQGSVTYKYSQKTIPIDDEVEQYIDRIECDTILYFSSATPDDLLPVEGEMMTCSFRDRFPSGFCHRCVERTEQGGLYRCVFTKCAYNEAFAKLQFDITPTEVVLPDGAYFVSQEEMDSIMNDYEDVEEPVASRSQNGIRTRADVRKEFNPITIGVNNMSLTPTFMGQSVAPMTGNFKITVGGYTQITYDSDTKAFYTEYGLHGDFIQSFEGTGSVGMRFESPIAIPILGFKCDLIVIGFDVGLTWSPYTEFKEERTLKCQHAYGFDIAVAYTKVGEGDGVLNVDARKIKKKRGLPMFSFRPESYDSNSGWSLHLRRGSLMNLGLGGEMFKVSADFSIGIDSYADFELNADLDAYISPEELKQREEKIPEFTLGYAQASAGLFGFSLPVSKKTDPIPSGYIKYPVLPVYKEGTALIYCSDFNPRTYKMAYELSDEGMLCSFIGGTPMIKVFPDAWGDDKALESFGMKWEEGQYHVKAIGTNKSTNLKNNKEYIAQLGVSLKMPRFSYFMPLYDIPLVTVVPEIKLSAKDVKTVQTLSAFNATPAELANPSVIAQRNGTYGWVQSGKVYRYRYKIDLNTKLEGTQLIRTWGIQMGDKFGNTSTFSHKESSTELGVDYVVRMTWYSNEPSFYLYFRPWADTQDAKGNKGGRLWETAVDYTVDYSSMLDNQMSITSGNPDFEKARRMTAPWNVPATELPFGEGAVLGEVEILE